MNLALGQQVRDEVRNVYKQRLWTKDGERVLITVPAFYSAEPLKVVQYKNVTAGRIPLDSNTREKFAGIDNFVKAAVNSPLYKAIWKGDHLLVNFSKWCKYELVQPDGSRQIMPPNTLLGKGMYSVVLQASHVYVGPHKSGDTFSVSLHIAELLYEPEQTLSDMMDDILNSKPPTPPSAVSPPKPKITRRRAIRKNKNEVEVPSLWANV